MASSSSPSGGVQADDPASDRRRPVPAAPPLLRLGVPSASLPCQLCPHQMEDAADECCFPTPRALYTHLLKAHRVLKEVYCHHFGPVSTVDATATQF